MELISKIGSSSSPIQLVQQFVQTICEHPDNLEESLRRLFNALKTKKPKNRGNIAFALTQLLFKMKNNPGNDFKKNGLDFSENVYEFSKEVLLQDSLTADHRRSTIACFFSWNAMCRADIFKNRHDIIIEKIIPNLFGISNERNCYRLIGYETIWSVIDTTYKSAQEFQKELFSNIINEMGSTGTPPHAESFALWIRISRKFPGLQLKKWATTPCSSGTFRSLSSLLEKTVTFLPQIHPVWIALSSADANLMIRNAMELWGSAKSPDDYIPMIASIAGFDYLEVQHFINILDMNSQYYMKISNSKYSELFTEAVLKAAERFAKIHKHRVVSLGASVIKCIRSAQLGKFLGTFSDGETRELLNYMSSNDNYKFGDYLELLWAQARRETLEDSTIVTNIFEIMMKKLENDDDRNNLIKFLCHISDQFSSDGKHWFSLISPDSEITGIIIPNKESLIKRSQLILEASKKIHEIVGIECENEYPPLTDFDSLINCTLELLKSNCEFCQSIGRFFAQSSLPFMDIDSFTKFSDEPLVMLKALSRPEFSAKAIPLLFDKIKLLPRTILSRPEKVVISIDQDGIMEALPQLITIIRSTKPLGFHVAIAQMLIDKLDEDNRQKLLEQVIDEQINDFKKSADSDFIPMFIKASLETAQHAVQIIVGKFKNNQSLALSKRARGWFEEASTRYDLNPELVAENVRDLIDIKYDDSKVSDRKKAEDVLGWLLNFLSIVKDKKIPPEPWLQCLEKFANSKSRSVQMLVQLLKEYVNDVNNNNADNTNDNK